MFEQARFLSLQSKKSQKQTHWKVSWVWGIKNENQNWLGFRGDWRWPRFYEMRPLALVGNLVSPWIVVSSFYIQHSYSTQLCCEERWLGPGWLGVNQWAVLVRIPKGHVQMRVKERNQWHGWGRHCSSSQAGLHGHSHRKSSVMHKPLCLGSLLC